MKNKDTEVCLREVKGSRISGLPPFLPPHSTFSVAWGVWDSQKEQNSLGMELEVKDHGFSS